MSRRQQSPLSVPPLVLHQAQRLSVALSALSAHIEQLGEACEAIIQADGTTDSAPAALLEGAVAEFRREHSAMAAIQELSERARLVWNDAAPVIAELAVVAVGVPKGQPNGPAAIAELVEYLATGAGLPERPTQNDVNGVLDRLFAKAAAKVEMPPGVEAKPGCRCPSCTMVRMVEEAKAKAAQAQPAQPCPPVKPRWSDSQWIDDDAVGLPDDIAKRLIVAGHQFVGDVRALHPYQLAQLGLLDPVSLGQLVAAGVLPEGGLDWVGLKMRPGSNDPDADIAPPAPVADPVPADLTPEGYADELDADIVLVDLVVDDQVDPDPLVVVGVVGGEFMPRDTDGAA